MIAVIVPHSRPERAGNLIAAFWRQTVTSKRMIVVENGPAVGTFPRGVPNVDVLQSEPHQAAAMNAGLARLRATGGGPWARFDDDDYYGPRYLEGVLADLAHADVVGKPWSFVLLDDGLWRFSIGRNDMFAENFELTGGSLAAVDAHVADFERRLDDDLQWCRDMRARGARLWSGSPWRYCYDRRGPGPRVWSAPLVLVKRSLGPAAFYGELEANAVDLEGAIKPIRFVSPPTDDEVCASVFC